jgi:hypothetical protein
MSGRAASSANDPNNINVIINDIALAIYISFCARIITGPSTVRSISGRNRK